MDVKILKIGTVIAYLLITWSGDHIGGTFAYYIIFGLFSIYTILISAIFLTVLIAFLFSSYKAFKKYDLHVFMVGGLILFIPIIRYSYLVISEYKSRGDDTFFLTLIPFLLLYGITLFKLHKQSNHDNKERV
ncbi:hypothetical protein L3049_04780 [Labilibaculum sp. DW002]|uniref:Exosortase n=1 Tax=Paralabilibaculum antarcticum TaxID=2912572 RepID=A0ABT5VPW4_9BACT|nr:hypothetical protein [Labilibaculum sp. DW002]MDE5417316.1 hypothetical protein [Labilibaculum sp. DW002]